MDTQTVTATADPATLAEEEALTEVVVGLRVTVALIPGARSHAGADAEFAAGASVDLPGHSFIPGELVLTAQELVMADFQEFLATKYAGRQTTITLEAEVTESRWS